VFVPEMDAEHKEMFRLAAELRRAFLAGAPPNELDKLQGRLAGEVTGHFAHEERLMRTASYAAFQWHESQHQTGRSRVAELGRQIQRGERSAIFESLESIARWLRDHTSVADRMAGAYLRNHARTARC